MRPLNLVFLLFFLVAQGSSFAQTLKIPSEFSGKKWYSTPDKDCLASGEPNLEGSGWSLAPYARLVFSKDHYAFGDPWSGIGSTGSYSVSGRQVKLDPPLGIWRWDEPYRISELVISTSDRETNSGNQVLIDRADTVRFVGWSYPEDSPSIVINGVKCVSQNTPVLLLENRLLYALPNQRSKNLFGPKNYYGGLATKAFVTISAAPVDPDSPWLYISLDFTADEPVDGGGPFYSGWIEKSKTRPLLGSSLLTVSDNLRLRVSPDTNPGTKIAKVLRKFTEAKILGVQPDKTRIDDIWDRWYQVSLEGGETGWIFGGYARLFQTENERAQLIARYKSAD